MSMFRFWSSDSRASGPAVDSGMPSPDYDNSARSATSTTSGSSPTPEDSTFSHRPVKRRRSSATSVGSPYQYYEGASPCKRVKTENVALLSPQPTFGDGQGMPTRDLPVRPDLEDARQTIQFQFGLEVLLKHDELRLINQELAKCQVALEQLRRCHLIPYPVSCPTPEQMLQISSGKGPALQTRPGEEVPRWAPPFGVVDGPYARHYAKWLIPDPAFGDVLPQPQGLPESGRSKNTTAEGRATRNSITETTMLGKPRPGRAGAGQKLQALSSGYAQPKDKQGPCTVKRSDGQTVKLICIDCHRWDFSSTQGFINHCRIAHRRDFKSHEEAAVHAGHPIELDEAGAVVRDEKPAPASSSATGLVHPFARNESITDQQGYASLLSRINDSLKLYHAGKLPNVKSIPGSEPKHSAQNSQSFTGTPTTPYLSQLLQRRNFSGNLSDQVEDAKTLMAIDDVLTPGEESEDPDLSIGMDGSSSPAKPATTAARTPAMRMPARTLVSPVPLPTIPRPASSKGQAPSSAFNVPKAPEKEESMVLYDEMDMDLSPNTTASHNAPSLVSDDGEYDDSDDGTSSESSEGLDAESVSDVAEIKIDEDSETTPRPIGHHRTNSATAAKLKKEEAKHVTFVTPITGTANAITGNTKSRRKQNV